MYVFKHIIRFSYVQTYTLPYGKKNESINKNVVIDCSLQFSFAVGCCEFNLAVKMHERSLWNWTSNTDTVIVLYGKKN